MPQKVPVLILPDRDKILLEPGMRLSIGRSAEQDIQINEEHISREHAEIYMDDDGTLRARDVGTGGSGSRNGTYIDHERNYGNFQEVLDGYEISLGNPDTTSCYKIVYHARWSSDQEESRNRQKSIDDTVIEKN